MAVSHWKSSIGVKLTNLVLATPQWAGDNGVSLGYAITPHHNIVIIACPSQRSTSRGSLPAPHGTAGTIPALVQFTGQHARPAYSASPSQRCPIKLSCNYLYGVLSKFKKNLFLLSVFWISNSLETFSTLSITLHPATTLTLCTEEPTGSQRTGNLELQKRANKSLWPTETTGR